LKLSDLTLQTDNNKDSQFCYGKTILKYIMVCFAATAAYSIKSKTFTNRANDEKM